MGREALTDPQCLYYKAALYLTFYPTPKGTETAVAHWLRCSATNRKVAGSMPADII